MRFYPACATQWTLRSGVGPVPCANRRRGPCAVSSLGVKGKKRVSGCVRKKKKKKKEKKKEGEEEGEEERRKYVEASREGKLTGLTEAQS